jgi:hypothetical protein
MSDPAWKDAREKALFQPANWLEMAKSSAVCGYPYNPGDTPGKTQPYGERIWSSWIARDHAPKAPALQPSEREVSALTFFHVLEIYGTADWTIYAKVVNAQGADANDEIVFTAAFTKVNASAKTIDTHLLAFNPGWTTRYVNFYRIGTAGTLGTTALNDGGPLAVPRKKNGGLSEVLS